MASPRSSRGKVKQRSTVTPTRSSPRIIRKATSYPNAVNRHFVDSVPILEVTLRFDEDEYDVWRRQDTDEVNLYYMLRIKYPRDEDEQAWQQELEKLKKEVTQVRVVEEGWFEGVWVPLEKAKDIARKYKIYDHVAALLESENSWFDTPKSKHARVKSERSSSISEHPSNATNGITINGSSKEIPLTNGNNKTEIRSDRQRTRSIRGDNNKEINNREITIKDTRETKDFKESRDLPTRLKEVEGERDHYMEEVKNLKRKLTETESYVNTYSGSGSSKKRAVFAVIGAAAGAGMTAYVLNNMG
ncbi:216_t:CDS:2 [Ambispora gerdemannii]|uniref:216_t:CDS:1 n=1 Tax=Ambispora gerdemannii TaxID=144530 RepID=A0A9N9FHG0_9GLOM|nr:216_t:CDS:2 [Ambispora gerdemannii]